MGEIFTKILIIDGRINIGGTKGSTIGEVCFMPISVGIELIRLSLAQPSL